ncbi:TetR/AcrR family transcriptional regulator [Acinetobacter sp. ANC 5579]|uniref:TetR/AcrR family transcriptional regulator n=1 Tax=Acinetobacter amyesii TaxID=2942470 RepID=UPI0020BEA3BC|nr:TetR/AcrR family transcriptional regulator [Acinetobacter amyesii]MCL6234450.1 TetR/AcrR family transcriptional regulator [Acinetobacter amyesii]
MNVGRPKDLEKRQRILESAKQLFLEMGYHGCSMNQIAQHAGVTKLTVYNHFQDKATLFTSAIEDTCENILNTRPRHLHSESHFMQAFVEICELGLNIMNLPEAIKLDLLLLELAAEHSPLVEQFFRASHLKMRQVWENFFQDAAALNFIQQDNPARQTELIVSLLMGLRHQEVLLGMRPVPEAAERQAIIHSAIDIFMLKYQLSAQS